MWPRVFTSYPYGLSEPALSTPYFFKVTLLMYYLEVTMKVQFIFQLRGLGFSTIFEVTQGGPLVNDGKLRFCQSC